MVGYDVETTSTRMLLERVDSGKGIARGVLVMIRMSVTLLHRQHLSVEMIFVKEIVGWRGGDASRGRFAVMKDWSESK